MTDATLRQPQPSALQHNIQYLFVSLFMFVLGMSAVFFVTYVRPSADNGITITAILGFTATTTASVLAFMKSQETHASVNSRMDEFIKKFEATSVVAQDKARLEGVASGRTEGRDIANRRTDLLATQGIISPPGVTPEVTPPVTAKLIEIAQHTKETTEVLKEIKEK